MRLRKRRFEFGTERPTKRTDPAPRPMIPSRPEVAGRHPRPRMTGKAAPGINQTTATGTVKKAPSATDRTANGTIKQPGVNPRNVRARMALEARAPQADGQIVRHTDAGFTDTAKPGSGKWSPRK